jgi:lipopolysaccharide biosynthesis glycosyltransferase
LTEAIADLKQQDYKATGIDMTKDRLNKLINSETLPAHFKGFRSNRFNAGNFINDLREWKKENPKKGKKLIDKIIRIQDQVVDVRKPNQSSKDVLKREILRQRYA